jgi:aflatoxin B1 aldehyde reductase
MAGIKNVFGGASIQSGRPFGNVAALRELFDVLKIGNCHTIDTSTVYGSSESILGQAGSAQQGIVVDTKTSGGISPGGATYRGILSDAQRSRERLGRDVGMYQYMLCGATSAARTQI